MTKYLPPNLLALFQPREPLEFKPPPDRLLIHRKPPKISGIAQYVGLFEDPKDTPPKPHIETRKELRQRKIAEKKELLAYKIESEIAKWKPEDNPKATDDPYKTIIVARLAYETTKSTLKRKFERYGRIKKVKIIHGAKKKPRGYAFVEFSHSANMSDAYKHADGMKIDDRRIVVDYERGRTSKSWLPRRFGGGRGNTRAERKDRDRSRRG